MLDVSLPGDYSVYSLPNGTINVAASATFQVLGGSGPYSFSQTTDGELPDGLSITSNTLTVSGTPLENGNFSPGFVFADSAGNTLFRFEGISIGGGTSTIGINNNGFNGYNLAPPRSAILFHAVFRVLRGVLCVVRSERIVAAARTLALRLRSIERNTHYGRNLYVPDRRRGRK